MQRRVFLGMGAAAAAAVLASPLTSAEAAGEVRRKLPAPDRKGGMPLMASMAARRSDHRPGPKTPDERALSTVLWAAWGRSGQGMRTVPTARNRQQMLLYAVLPDGVWRYEDDHSLSLVLPGDRRSAFDGAGCILLFAGPADDPYTPMHAGSMYQNAGLACVSLGLRHCVKHQKFDSLDAELPLPAGWRTCITLSLSA